MSTQVPLEYVTSFAQSSQAAMQQLAAALLNAGEQGSDFTRFTKAAASQQDYLAQMSAVWMDTMMRPYAAGAAETPGKPDRRFACEAWKQSPYHEFLRKAYLVNARYVNKLIEDATVDEKTRANLRLTDCLKLYFPQVLRWFDDVTSPLVGDLLERWPTGIHFNDHIEADGVTVFAHACKLGCEGIVSKDRTRPYRSGRSMTWLKIKNPTAPDVTRFEERDASA